MTTTPRRVILHVGAPKTGTSYVQDVLFQNRAELEELGILYPADRFDEHFLAALDLMELRWGGLEEQAVGAWERLAARVRDWPGTTIVSHEILAAASREQVRRALASFGDAEVHVVMSVRDLARQVPAEWQENVKHRRVITYRDFLDAITAPAPTREISTWFWGVQDVPAVLDRWGADLPPEQVHVITVPPRGSPTDLLWRRFAAVFGFAPDALDVGRAERINPSMGVAETALVRAVNHRVNHGVLANVHYREFVRELLAHRTLSRREHMNRLVLPPDVHPWAVSVSERWIETLAQRGYQVEGDLADLRPAAAADTPYVDPDAVGPEALHDPSMTALVTLLTRAGEMREEIDDLHRRLRDTEADRDRAVQEAGVVLRAKRALVAREESSRAVAVALSAYRRARGAAAGDP